ncbi:MAG: hypothetical protein K2K93_01550, partial [Muribaculaceae bacterium]|nr:hypothetical protein [Muribaculaceae bacterium]
DQSDHYPERYIQFYNAIKEKYPNVHCIGNVESWATDYPSWRNEYPVEIVDEHYYRNPKWFADRFNKYDSYDRAGHKVYVGEYAVTDNFGDLGNMNAALGEAVFMMGMENNSDVVVMNSYAPIFVNENDARWRPDMIRFNSSESMGTPSYYVQGLFANNIGTQVVATDWIYDLTKPQRDEAEVAADRHVGLASWATSVAFRDPQLIVDGKHIDISDYAKWESRSGEWTVTDGEIMQTGGQQPAVFVCPENISTDKYTYKVKAKKLSGKEGFMAVFGYKDARNYGWFNVGGWGNTQNNVEQCIDGSRVPLCRDKRFSVEEGRWYDLEVVVDGDSVQCYLDGMPDLSCRLLSGSTYEGVFASSTIDDAGKMLYVKVVNLGDGYADGVVNLENCEVDGSKDDALVMTRLSAASGGEENTLADPVHIAPEDVKLEAEVSDCVKFNVMPFSVNIIKIPLK